MASTISWELYRTFLSVLNEGSLSGAARSLGITQPTAGRHVAALENALGLALFTRSPTGLLPTEAALALRTQVEAMESTAASLERTAASQGDGVRGAVRVTASDMIGVEVLPPILGQLRREHPELEIELVLTNRVQDLLRREADIAVRMTSPKQEMLIARRIGKIEVGMHATRRYLDQYGTPRTLNDFSAHTLVGFDAETDFIRAARKLLPTINISRERFALRSDSDVAQLALIRAGAGLGLCQVPLAKRTSPEPLVRVLPRQISLPLETWITMHEDLRNRPSCRVTFEALVSGLQRHIAAGSP